MKHPWPVAFADGDMEARVTEFEKTAICNGVKDDTLLTALCVLLSGRVKAVLNLHTVKGTGPTYQEMRAGLSI